MGNIARGTSSYRTQRVSECVGGKAADTYLHNICWSHEASGNYRKTHQKCDNTVKEDGAVLLYLISSETNWAM